MRSLCHGSGVHIVIVSNSVGHIFPIERNSGNALVLLRGCKHIGRFESRRSLAWEGQVESFGAVFVRLVDMFSFEYLS